MEKSKNDKKKKLLIWFISIILLILIGIAGYSTKFYFDLKETANKAYDPVKRDDDSNSKTDKDYKQGKPFSVLFLGIDTDDSKIDKGRSDEIIVATINPKKETTTLVSIPEDLCTDINGMGEKSIINEVYNKGGASMTISTVEKLLDIPIDHYAEINFRGMKDLINVLGGVEVTNPYSFTYKGTFFPIGQLNLNGEKAVKYLRMRNKDVRSGYDRQTRGREVMSSMLDKVVSAKTLVSYPKLLNILGNNTKMDITWERLQIMVEKYTSALKNVKTDQLVGEEFAGDGIIGAKGKFYQNIEENDLKRVQQELKENLAK